MPRPIFKRARKKAVFKRRVMPLWGLSDQRVHEFLFYRAWVSMGATGAWHPSKIWTLPLAPADLEVLNTDWHPQSSFYVTSGTLSFKFLTQALLLAKLVKKFRWSMYFSWLTRSREKEGIESSKRPLNQNGGKFKWWLNEVIKYLPLFLCFNWAVMYCIKHVNSKGWEK